MFVFLFEILKKSILHRYLSMYDPNEKELRTEHQYWIDVSLQELEKLSSVSLKEKVKYHLLAKFPLLYRLMRIAIDPTMIQWERSQRKKLKEYKEKVRING